MRLTLAISSLSAGGAERVMSIMATYWAAKGWPITLLTWDNGHEPPFYPLDPRVRHIALDLARPSANALVGLGRNLKRLSVLRRAIRQSQPEAVISFVDRMNVITLLATRGLHIPVVVSERYDPAHYSPGQALEKLRRWVYPQAVRLVVQSEAARHYFAPDIQRIACVIPNPVSFPAEFQAMNHPRSASDKKTLLGMGRLGKEKGFDLLLRAFAGVAAQYSDWSLEIWGEGPERPALESLCYELGLAGRVRLPGLTRQPFAQMQQADLFVLSSRFEGFPNVLCEAMACGLPVISFDCPSGPREIIRHGADGLLVPPENVTALANALSQLMSDSVEREQLAARAPEVLERFGLEKVMGMWETLLQEVTGSRI